MKVLIEKIIRDHKQVVKGIEKEEIIELEKAIHLIVNAFNNKNKLLITGNGGSAADSQHIAAEFVNKFKLDREPLPAIALTTDSSILTSIGNDDDYSRVFEKQIKALGKQEDIVLALTTSDFTESHSMNLYYGLKTAKELGMKTIGLVSKKSKNIMSLLDVAVVAQSEDTPRIQEVHTLFYHIICELVEMESFTKP